MECPNNIRIPENIVNYLDRHNGVVLTISINATDGINGYGHLMQVGYELKKLTRTCHRCGYDPVWRPDLWENHGGGRHTYGSWRYDMVFCYIDNNQELSLEQAFDQWLEKQPTEYEWDKPMRRMIFGKEFPC